MENRYKINPVVIAADFGAIILLLIMDQITKFMSVNLLKDQEPFIIVKNIIQFMYLENHGAAFGMLQNQQWIFIITGIAFLLFSVFAFIYIPTISRYVPLRMCILLIAAGALGNIIDRIRLSYVIDFIYFEYINFPVFNIADIYVTIGTFCLIILVLFHYKDEDLDMKKFHQKGNLK